MTILLDTCTFLWMATDEKRLSPTARTILGDPANRRLLSAISVLELAIKTRIGKLTLHAPLDQVLAHGMQRGAIDKLSVTHEHSAAVAQLPLHHRDPFDRMLVAQAITEGIPIVTDDAEIRRYAANVIW